MLIDENKAKAKKKQTNLYSHVHTLKYGACEILHKPVNTMGPGDEE